MMHFEIVWDYSGVKWYSFYVQVLKALNLIMKTLLVLLCRYHLMSAFTSFLTSHGVETTYL